MDTGHVGNAPSPSNGQHRERGGEGGGGGKGWHVVSSVEDLAYLYFILHFDPDISQKTRIVIRIFFLVLYTYNKNRSLHTGR